MRYEREAVLCPRLAYGIQEVARSIRVSSTNKIVHCNEIRTG